MHAIFKQDMAKSSWAMSSRLLKGFVDHFGPKTEQLDIFSKDGRATFTSFTEKVVSGKGIMHISSGYPNHNNQC
jgi:cell cycle checkpoint control protein RAD9A